MKKLLTWVLLFQKRILKKPMFQITLLLIPVLLFLLFFFNKSSDSLVRVALLPGNDAYSQNFAEELLDSSNHVISYYLCDDKSQLRSDVIKGRAECGYIFPDDMEKRISDYAENKKNPILTAIVKKESVSTKVVNEILYGKLFSGTAYQILKDFVDDKQPGKLSTDENDKMYEIFSSYRVQPLMFSFEYADGKKNDMLNDNSDTNNYYMLPVRGLLSVLIMVSAMSGILMLSGDEKKGTWNFIRLSKRPFFNYFYIFMSIFPVALCSLIAIFFTGISTNIINELILMLLYSLLLTGFCNLIKVIFNNIYVLCSFIPVIVLLSLVICPVFIDLGGVVSQVNIIRLFLPANYYLDAIYSSLMQLKMLILAVIVSMAGIFIDSKKETAH